MSTARCIVTVVRFSALTIDFNASPQSYLSSSYGKLIPDKVDFFGTILRLVVLTLVIDWKESALGLEVYLVWQLVFVGVDGLKSMFNPSCTGKSEECK